MQQTTPLHAVLSRPVEAAMLFLCVFFLIATFLHIADFFPEPIGTHATTSSKASAALARPQIVSTVYAASSTVVATAHASAPVAAAAPSNTRAAVTATQVGAGLPTRIVIPKVGVDTPVINPTASDLATLDAALLKGAARYPTSATPTTEGSVLIFGHQSYLPVVRNKAFTAFNDVQKLVAGDTITVYTAAGSYTYRVRSVTLTTVEAGNIPLETVGRTLTLVTCNSLGAKEERYIIKADLITSGN